MVNMQYVLTLDKWLRYLDTWCQIDGGRSNDANGIAYINSMVQDQLSWFEHMVHINLHEKDVMEVNGKMIHDDTCSTQIISCDMDL